MRYPRTCRGAHGPHTIEGPEDEDVKTSRGREFRTCRACNLEGNLLCVERYQASTKGHLSRAKAYERKSLQRTESLA